MIYCRICRDHRKIDGFHRDDPILSCGHIKCRSSKDDKAQEVRYEIEEMFREEADTRGVAVEEIRTEFVQGLLDIFGSQKIANTVGNCKTCGTVTVNVGTDGTRRCGGNLIDNPGCGMPIGSAEQSIRDVA